MNEMYTSIYMKFIRGNGSGGGRVVKLVASPFYGTMR